MALCTISRLYSISGDFRCRSNSEAARGSLSTSTSATKGNPSQNIINTHSNHCSAISPCPNSRLPACQDGHLLNAAAALGCLGRNDRIAVDNLNPLAVPKTLVPPPHVPPQRGALLPHAPRHADNHPRSHASHLHGPSQTQEPHLHGVRRDGSSELESCKELYAVC
jgi:hypothetical protein